LKKRNKKKKKKRNKKKKKTKPQPTQKHVGTVNKSKKAKLNLSATKAREGTKSGGQIQHSSPKKTHYNLKKLGNLRGTQIKPGLSGPWTRKVETSNETRWGKSKSSPGLHQDVEMRDRGG